MTQSLPKQPDLDQLKKQAKELHRSFLAKDPASGALAIERHPEFAAQTLETVFLSNFQLADAQLTLAREYGFGSWQKMKSFVESFPLHGKWKSAINANDVDLVRKMLSETPELLLAPIGYGGSPSLTWVAECRVPYVAPGPERLEIAQMLIDAGADVHENGDAPLMRAALNDERIPMMELLLRNGADVNGKFAGRYPIVHGACECLAPLSLKWLLAHGADPNLADTSDPNYGTPLDMAIATYDRKPVQHELVNALIEAGGESKFANFPSVFIHRGRLDLLEQALKEDPTLVNRRFPELDYGASGARGLTLKGATLLHVAAEYGELEAMRLLLNHGADANAISEIDSEGVGGCSAVFHSATQFRDFGLEATRLLIEKGANLSISAKLPSSYEKPGEFVTVTPLGYAARFPYHFNEHGVSEYEGTIQLLIRSGAPAGDVYAASRLGLLNELTDLLNSGHDPNLAHPLGETALEAAEAKGYSKVVELLRSAGARG